MLKWAGPNSTPIDGFPSIYAYTLWCGTTKLAWQHTWGGACLEGHPRHSYCTNASRGLSTIAEFPVLTRTVCACFLLLQNARCDSPGNHFYYNSRVPFSGHTVYRRPNRHVSLTIPISTLDPAPDAARGPHLHVAAVQPTTKSTFIVDEEIHQDHTGRGARAAADCESEEAAAGGRFLPPSTRDA